VRPTWQASSLGKAKSITRAFVAALLKTGERLQEANAEGGNGEDSQGLSE